MKRGGPPFENPGDGISILCPIRMSAEAKRLRNNARALVVAHVIREAVQRRGHDDLLTEIYLAGLWHGAELARMGRLETESA